MGRSVVHFEIGCSDSAKTQKFYRELFDWKIEPQGAAATIEAEPGGLSGHITSLGHPPHQYTTIYVQVEDIAAALKHVESLGGSILVPAVQIPTGTFAWMKDPEDNTIGLWKPKI